MDVKSCGKHHLKTRKSLKTLKQETISCRLTCKINRHVHSTTNCPVTFLSLFLYLYLDITTFQWRLLHLIKLMTYRCSIPKVITHSSWILKWDIYINLKILWYLLFFAHIVNLKEELNVSHNVFYSVFQVFFASVHCFVSEFWWSQKLKYLH